MLKRIRFVPYDAYAFKNIPAPASAKGFIPKWYKDAEIAISEKTGKAASLNDKNISGGLKSCMPFLDAMISGYLICSWEDYYVKTSESLEEIYPVSINPYTDKYERTTSHGPEMLRKRDGDIGHTIPRPEGYCSDHMVFGGQWGARLPRGWSALITHPLNRFDLPFMSTSGIMDADEWWTGGNIPFFFKKNFEGIIPSGTPFAQIIPIKRSSWISYISTLSVKRQNYLADKVRSIPIGWYRNNIWVKKKYE
jgi:hypothetical protein